MSGRFLTPKLSPFAATATFSNAAVNTLWKPFANPFAITFTSVSRTSGTNCVGGWVRVGARSVSDQTPGPA